MGAVTAPSGTRTRPCVPKLSVPPSGPIVADASTAPGDPGRVAAAKAMPISRPVAATNRKTSHKPGGSTTPGLLGSSVVCQAADSTVGDATGGTSAVSSPEASGRSTGSNGGTPDTLERSVPAKAQAEQPPSARTRLRRDEVVGHSPGNVVRVD